MIAIVLAAGKGTRMRPLSYVIPKILLPVRGKPVLDYLLSGLSKVDLERIYIIASEHLDTIQTYIDKTNLKNVFVIRGLGWETGGDLAIGLHSLMPIDDDIIVMNGDIVSDISFKSLITDHFKGKNYATMGVFNIKDTKEAMRFGQVIMDSKGEITKFVEKNEVMISDFPLVNSGFYVFSKELVADSKKLLIPRKFRLENDFFPELSKNHKLHGSICNLTYWWDVGTMESYLSAEQFFIDGKAIIPPGNNEE